MTTHSSQPVWLNTQEGFLTLDVLVSPHASRNRLMGVYEDRLKIQLAAPPVNKRANEALVKFLADLLGVPKAQIEIVGGGASKRKTVRLANVTEKKAIIKLTPMSG